MAQKEPQTLLIGDTEAVTMKDFVVVFTQSSSARRLSIHSQSLVLSGSKCTMMRMDHLDAQRASIL